VISNFPSRTISALLRAMVFPLGRPYVVPSDKLGHEVARLLIEPSATRDRLTAGMYLPDDEGEALGAIELALAATLAAEPIEARMRDAFKAGRFSAVSGADRGAAALEAGVITADELRLLRRASELADRVIRVDDFAQDLGASELKPSAAAAPVSTAGRKVAAA
jgi:acyl-CoA dehydrogenase